MAIMKKRSVLNQKGFSLIEILIALALVALVLAVVVGDSFSSRNKLEEIVSLVERSMRSSVDEAALRNVITRINFKLDEEVQEFAVEYGPDADFVIPTSLVKIATVESVSENELRQSETQKVDKQFNRVKELAEKPFEVEYPVRILGIGTRITGAFVVEGSASIYVYPTGERDAAFIVLATDQELAVLTTQPFNDEITIDYHLLGEENEFSQKLEKAEELFKGWRDES